MFLIVLSYVETDKKKVACRQLHTSINSVYDICAVNTKNRLHEISFIHFAHTRTIPSRIYNISFRFLLFSRPKVGIRKTRYIPVAYITLNAKNFITSLRLCVFHTQILVHEMLKLH